jgi:predicted TIM-barrel fold metal-dependent hydrolase
MTRRSAPEEPLLLPIKIDSTTNSEYWPVELSPELRHAKEGALSASLENAAHLGWTRRDYLRSSCAAATTLMALNQLGCAGGRYQVTDEAPLDKNAAASTLEGDEFIFDIQTHFVSTDRPWWKVEKPSLADFLTTTPKSKCGAPEWVQCFADDVMLKEVFLDSDTDLAVLSALWGVPHPTPIEEAVRARESMAKAGGKSRLRIHGIVQPNETDFERIKEHMHALVSEWKIDAYKLYPTWGPEQRGYFLDGELGRKTIEHGMSLGLNLFAVHKGMPLPEQDPKFTRPIDVGPAARAFPEAKFLIYHSAYETEHTEGAYDASADRGVDALIKSLADNTIGKDGNVYAELGGTWRELMKKPDEAAHVLGKLLVHLGEDRILWGTDAIWYGSPQDQIQAFRAFEITPQFQEQFGYPALTKEIKAKIFGLNAAKVYGVDQTEIRRAQQRDPLSRAKERYGEDPQPSHLTYGPKTRREMLSFLEWERKAR